MFSLVRQLPRPRRAALGVFSSDCLYLPSLTGLVESPGVEPSYLDFQSSAPTAYANFPYVLGGKFIERYAAVTPQSITKGKRRFRAYYLSRISIRLSLNYRCISNYIDNVLTFKLGIFCIPLPWVCPKDGGYY